MQRPIRPAPSLSVRANERGSALMMVMIMTVLLLGFAVSLYSVSWGNKDRARITFDQMKLFVAAESGIAQAEAMVAQDIANWRGNRYSLTAPVDVNYTFDEISVTVSILQIDVNPDAGLVTLTKEDADGIQTQVDGYMFTSLATMPAFNDPAATVDKTVKRFTLMAKTPLFQFVAFYENDLEITAGANMNITGRLHTNSSFYACPDGSTMTFNSNYVRAVGEIRRRRKDETGRQAGTVKIKKLGLDGSDAASYLRMDNKDQIGVASESGFDSKFTGYDAAGDGDLDDPGDISNWTAGAVENWGGTVKTGVHGTTKWSNPEVESKEALRKLGDGSGNYNINGEPVSNGDYASGGMFHEMAMGSGLCIIKGKDGVVRAWRDGVSIPAADVAAFASETSTYDVREGGANPVLQLDMKQLSTRTFTNPGSDGVLGTGDDITLPVWPRNGLVYTARFDGVNDSGYNNKTDLKADLQAAYQDGGHTPAEAAALAETEAASKCKPYGIRLANGSNILVNADSNPDIEVSGLMLVTQNPVYVMGDLNTGVPEQNVNLATCEPLGGVSNAVGLTTADGMPVKTLSGGELTFVPDGNANAQPVKVAANPDGSLKYFINGASVDPGTGVPYTSASRGPGGEVPELHSDPSGVSLKMRASGDGYVVDMAAGSVVKAIPDLKTGTSLGTELETYSLPDAWRTAHQEAGKIPCAVMGDSINLLSERYNSSGGSKDDGSYGDARPTYFNSAFVTGSQETVFNGERPTYNGGLENLMRFHEKWGSGNKCFIRGSFVNIWDNHYAQGRWSTARYGAPARDWNFETDFFNSNKLPPFTPMVAGPAQSVQWEE